MGKTQDDTRKRTAILKEIMRCLEKEVVSYLYVFFFFFLGLFIPTLLFGILLIPLKNMNKKNLINQGD